MENMIKLKMDQNSPKYGKRQNFVMTTILYLKDILTWLVSFNIFKHF